jgi:hypothetical protein
VGDSAAVFPSILTKPRCELPENCTTITR